MKALRLKNLQKLLGLFVAAYLIYIGPILFADSSGYLVAHPIRSAGLPIIILFFQMVFGRFAINVLFVVQVLLLLVAIQYFLSFLKKKFGLSDFVILLLSLVYYFYFFQRGGYILSEPLSIILFLFSIKVLLESIFDNKSKSMYVFYILMIFLVLVRGQFYFMYPITFLVIVFLHYKNRNWKLSIRYFALLVAVVVITNLADRTYHYAKHGRFIVTPFTGLQLVTNALYVSQQNDSLLFEIESERKMFNEVFASISKKGLILESLKKEELPVGRKNMIHHYNLNYNKISHNNTKNIIGSYFEDWESIDYWKSIDEITLNMAYKLIRKHPFEFFQLYMLNILINGFSLNFFMILFTLIAFVLGLIAIIRDPENKPFIFLVLSILIVLANFSLVALVEPILQRYSLYGTMLYLTSVFIFLANEYNRLVNNKQKSTST